VSQGFEFSFHF